MNNSKVEKFLFLMLIILTQGIAHAQTSDSTVKVKSTNNVDSVIESKAKQYEVTYWLFKNLYDEPTKDNIQTSKITKPKPEPLQKHKGKVIRHLIIKSMDPFGTDINDTLLYYPDALGTWANRINIASTNQNIRNLLLFEEGQTLDPLSLRESERLLRRQEYVRDARVFVPSTTKKNSDTVDVVIVVQNRWSINVGAGFSTTDGDFNVTETNFLGTGSRISQRGRFDFQNMRFTDWSGELKDVNIRKSYIDGSLFYNVAPGTRSYGILFDRTFFSPLTKWAGSAGVIRFNNDLEYQIQDQFFVPAKAEFYASDFWLGRSLALGRRTVAGRSTSVVLATRYTRTDYVTRPPDYLDTIKAFENQELIMFSLGISSRRYYKDTKIYRFGNVEDVPEGRAFNIIFGKYNEGPDDFLYQALRLSAGQRFTGIGYFEAGAEYGIYYDNYKPSRGVFNFDSYYFTDLIERGPWSMRQFVALNVTNGLNRTSGDRITINGRGQDGMFGFNSNIAYGENKTILKFQTLVYTPFSFAGIQLSMFSFVGFGKIGRPFYPELNPHTIYQAYGVGIQARKENLAINTIQISLGYYPNIPRGTGPELRYNPIGLNSVRFKDFDISKPELVDYR